MRKYVLAVALVSLPMLANCGSPTACVVPGPSGTTGWDFCYDDWSEDECSALGADYSEGSTCEDLGFTKICPESSKTAKNRPGYDC